MKRTIVSAVLSLLFSLTAVGQIEREGPLPPVAPPECRQGDWICEQRKHEREKARNKQRHADLTRDTDKLLQLATELKQAVDKSDENTLSLDVIRKTDEIEKLAKSVRNKMKAE